MNNKLVERRRTLKNKAIEEYVGYVEDFQHLENLNVDNLMNLATEVINNNITNNVKEDMQEILSSYEFISQILNLDEDKNAQKAYNYGMIYSIAALLIKLANDSSEKEQINDILHRYKYLNQILEFVNNNGLVTGPEIVKHLNMNSRSSLTNFMNRIKDINLFTIRKIGNVNYYSLSLKGEKYVQYLESHKEHNALSFENNIYKYFILLLDNLSKELKKEQPEAYNVINETNLKMDGSVAYSSRLVEKKIKKIISSRSEAFVRCFRNIDYSEDCYMKGSDFLVEDSSNKIGVKKSKRNVSNNNSQSKDIFPDRYELPINSKGINIKGNLYYER